MGHPAMATVAVGTATAAAGFLAALTVFGPVVSRLFGWIDDPLLDFTPPEDRLRGLLVQALALALSYLLMGIGVGMWAHPGRSLRWGLWAANPLTVGCGFVLYSYLGLDGPSQYFLRLSGAQIALFSPLLLAPFAALGVRLAKRRRATES